MKRLSGECSADHHKGFLPAYDKIQEENGELKGPATQWKGGRTQWVCRANSGVEKDIKLYFRAKNKAIGGEGI